MAENTKNLIANKLISNNVEGGVCAAYNIFYCAPSTL